MTHFWDEDYLNYEDNALEFEPWNLGFDDGIFDRPKSNNPFIPGTPEWREYMDGWKEGKECG